MAVERSETDRRLIRAISPYVDKGLPLFVLLVGPALLFL